MTLFTKSLLLICLTVAVSAVAAGSVSASTLTVSCTSSPASSLMSPLDLNTLVTFTPSVSGQVGNVSYTWFGSCTGSSATCQNTFSSAGTYTAYVTVTDGADSQTASCTAYVNYVQSCTPNTTKQCVGNAVYNFDSCGTQGSIYQQCASGQTCSNAQCVSQTIRCNNNSDCGSSTTSGTPFCSGNSIYQNFITFTCNSPGTPSSFCSNSTAQQFQSSCSGNQTCTNGYCQNSYVNNCVQNSTQQCIGNYLYWYDSCGNQGSVSQYCPNGCNGNSCGNNYSYGTVQTLPATSVSGGQATFNGSYNNTNSNYSYNTYVWFQYGPTTSYGMETSRQTQNYSGLFSQIVSNLYSGTYHVRAVAQQCSGNGMSGQYYCSGTMVYGQDITVGSAPVSGNLSAVKTVRNLTTGTGFASSVYASPSDELMFMITLKAQNQDVQNVVVKDYLPTNLIYGDQLIVACTTNNTYSNCNGTNYNYSGNIGNGVVLGTVYSGQTVTITYHARVAAAQNFAYGQTTLTNNVSVTSSSANTPASNASVVVTRGQTYATNISTGLTNNIWVDSFILPLLITLMGIWMMRNGMFMGIEKCLDSKRKNRSGYKAQKELNQRILEIRKSENI